MYSTDCSSPMAIRRPMTMVLMWTKKSCHVRIPGCEGCTSGKAIRCSSKAVDVPASTVNSGGVDATAAAAEVSGDGACGALVALPFRTGSSVSSTIPFMMLEVDATFNLEHCAGAETTASRCEVQVVQRLLLAAFSRSLTPGQFGSGFGADCDIPSRRARSR